MHTVDKILKISHGGFGVIEVSKSGEYIVQKRWNNESVAIRCSWDNGISWSQWEYLGNKLDVSNIILLTPSSSSVTNYAAYGGSFCYKIGSRVHLHIRSTDKHD